MSVDILRRTTVCFRSFRGPEEDGSLSTKNAYDMDNKRDTMTNFNSSLPFSKGLIATTKDLPEVGKLIFNSESLSKLNMDVVFTTSTSKNVSYAGMLNPLMERAATESDYCAIISPSIIGKNSESGILQIQYLARIFDQWEKSQPGKLATVGTLIEGEQDPDLAQAVIDGTDEINLQNLWRVFPNNTMSIVRSSARFSYKTDNGALGTFMLNDKKEKLGGNEDFYHTFECMLNGQDCVVLINPVMPGERTGKVETVGQKVQRREFVYSTYAQLLVMESLKQKAYLKLTKDVKERYSFDNGGNVEYSPEMKNKLDEYNDFVEQLDTLPEAAVKETVEAVVRNTVDKHLYFAKINESGLLEIVLTKRQKQLIPSF